MGLILDSSVVIVAERQRETVAQLLRRIVSTAGDQRVALSAVGLTELAHAIYRAQNPVQRQNHERFIADLLADMEVVPYAKATALLAGKIDGEQRAQGVTIPFVDLLIGVTALEHGYTVATVNLRHFRLIPGLEIIPF
jgi:predicted nucleic acid-binding protein